MTQTSPSTVGALSADAIGRDRIIVQHEGSTLSGLLVDLSIDADVLVDGTWAEPSRTIVADVRVSITLGSITIAGLRREHPCEVIA